MKLRSLSILFRVFVVLLIPLIGFSLEVEDARNAGCLPQASVQPQSGVCASCHKDSQKRWASNQYRPCTPYCMGCHKKAEMDRHHPVGTALPRIPDNALHLVGDKKMACTTCHDLEHPRYDSVRWKATSLFDRLFREEPRYKTYFLALRNNQGQLCLSCH